MTLDLKAERLEQPGGASGVRRAIARRIVRRRADQLGAAVAAEGISVRRLPSGAGHDGMAMIALADIGMLFVRCTGGISHNPAEAISEGDVAVAARVFLRFIERFRPKRAP